MVGKMQIVLSANNVVSPLLVVIRGTITKDDLNGWILEDLNEQPVEGLGLDAESKRALRRL
jgi:hypothetical protein